MIFHFQVKCAGCRSKIVLRLQVGIDSIQPFYFVCQNCGAPTKGTLKIDYRQDPPITALSLEDTKLVNTYWENPDQTITVAPDLPCRITPSGSSTSQFPFIYQTELMENDYFLLEYQERVGAFVGLVQENWSKYRRLISYYLDRNWQQFDKEFKNIFRKRVPKSATKLDRHDIFEHGLLLIFGYIQPNEIYLKLIKEINDFISAATARNWQALYDFACSIDDKELVDYQTKLLERLSFIAENFSTLSPGFPILFYTSENKSDLTQIRIMRDDFELLKSHYISCFEISHKVLKIIVGMINVFLRGNGDTFPEDKPQSLERFTKLANAQKPAFIDTATLPIIASQWNVLLGRKIRNAIGHYGIRHDLRTGLLIQDNIEEHSIPYSEFVVKNLELLPMLQYCLHVVKKIYAIKIILGEGTHN